VVPRDYFIILLFFVLIWTIDVFHFHSTALVDTLLLSFPLLTMLIAGAKVNLQVHQDIEALISHRMAFRLSSLVRLGSEPSPSPKGRFMDDVDINDHDGGVDENSTQFEHSLKKSSRSDLRSFFRHMEYGEYISINAQIDEVNDSVGVFFLLRKRQQTMHAMTCWTRPSKPSNRWIDPPRSKFLEFAQNSTSLQLC
jgi:hypothetical protein